MTIPYLGIIYLLDSCVSGSDLLDPDAGEATVACRGAAEAIVVIDQDLVVVATARQGLGVVLRRDTAVGPMALAIGLGDRPRTNALPQFHPGQNRTDG